MQKCSTTIAIVPATLNDVAAVVALFSFFASYELEVWGTGDQETVQQVKIYKKKRLYETVPTGSSLTLSDQGLDDGRISPRTTSFQPFAQMNVSRRTKLCTAFVENGANLRYQCNDKLR